MISALVASAGHSGKVASALAVSGSKDFKGEENRHCLAISYAGQQITWEFIFNSDHYDYSPDVVFHGDPEFFPAIENIDAFRDFDYARPDSLDRLLNQLLQCHMLHSYKSDILPYIWAQEFTLYQLQEITALEIPYLHHQFQSFKSEDFPFTEFLLRYKPEPAEPFSIVTESGNLTDNSAAKASTLGDICVSICVPIAFDLKSVLSCMSPTENSQEVESEASSDIPVGDIQVVASFTAPQVWKQAIEREKPFKVNLVLTSRVTNVLNMTADEIISVKFSPEQTLWEYCTAVQAQAHSVVPQLRASLDARRKLVLAFFATSSHEVVEYDFPRYHYLALVLEEGPHSFLALLNLSTSFPNVGPTVTLQSSLYSSKDALFKKEYTPGFGDGQFPYSPRWGAVEIAERLRKWISTTSVAFLNEAKMSLK